MPYWLESSLNSPEILIGVGVAILVFVVCYLAMRQPRTFKAFDTDGGGVLVTRKAVRDLVRRCCEEMGEIGSAHIGIRLKGGTLNARVRLRVHRNANLKGISGYLREQIIQALTENLGVEGIGDIEIVVVGILEDAKPVVEG